MIAKNTGIVVGIVGDWGSGKTSYMRLIERQLNTELAKQIITVWFSAWKYQDVDHLGELLIYEVYEKTSETIPSLKGNLEKLAQSLGKKKSVYHYVERALAVAKDLNVAPPIIQTGLQLSSGIMDEIAEAKSTADVDKLVNELAKKVQEEKKLLIVFLDDLDRAYPYQIKAILTTIRLLLDRPGLITVLGYDENYVLSALGSHLPKGISPALYLQKIIGYRVLVPPPESNALRAFAQAVLLTLFPMVKEGQLYSSSDTLLRLTSGNPRRIKRSALGAKQLLWAAGVRNIVGYEMATEGPIEAAINLFILNELAPTVYAKSATFFLFMDERIPAGNISNEINRYMASTEFVSDLSELKSRDADIVKEIVQWLSQPREDVFLLSSIFGRLLSYRHHREPETVSISCAECGAENPTTNEYCGKCGNRLEARPTH